MPYGHVNYLINKMGDDDNKIFNFLRVDAKTLTLLNDKCEKSQDNLNYNLKLVE